MADSQKAMLRIEWIRSGTGFSCKQREAVRSLGLRRLHHVVERQDTPQVRGLIARVSHLVEVVGDAKRPGWTSVPEYIILPSEAASGAAPVPEPAAEETGETPGAEAAK
jgi:large subunit ribosomal protein L30